MRRVWRFHDFWGARPAPAVLLVLQVYDLAAYISAAGADRLAPPAAAVLNQHAAVAPQCHHWW